MLNLRNKKQLLSTPDGLPVIGGEEKLDFNMPEAANISNGFDYSNDADLSKHLGISDEAAVPLGGDFQDALPQIDPVLQEALRRGEEFQAARSQPEVASNTLIDSRGLPIINPPKSAETTTQTQLVVDEQPKANLPVIGAVDPIEAALKAKEAEYSSLGRRTDEHKHSKWSRVAAAIEGWAKGGLFEGIKAARNPHHFEDQKVADEKAKLLPEIGTLTQMRDAKVNAAAKVAATNDIIRRPEKEAADREARAKLAVQRINLNADIRSGIAKPFIDENGKVWRQYLNADSTGKVRPNEPVVGPDGLQEWVPGEQGISWFNPRTKQTEIIKAKQGASADAMIAGGDAGRLQETRKTNAAKQFEAIKENINNHIQYQNNLTTQLNNVLGAEAAVLASNGTIQGINSEMQAKNTELQSLLSAPETDDDKEMKARVDRVNQLTDEMVKLNGRFTEELGKTEAGRTKAAQIKAIVDKMKAPGKVTYTPFEAVQIGAVPQGKPVPASKDPLGLFR